MVAIILPLPQEIGNRYSLSNNFQAEPRPVMGITAKPSKRHKQI